METAVCTRTVGCLQAWIIMDTAFSFILLFVSTFFLLPWLLHFFFFLFLLLHPCQKLFVSVGIVLACVHHPHQHTSSSWCQHNCTTHYAFFFFNVASKTLAWRVDHWNTCQNWWWWSWITPEMVECWNLHDLVTLCMYHYWFEMGSLMDYQALF